MLTVETITGTAGTYVLTGTVSRIECGHYVANVATHLLSAAPLTLALRSSDSSQVCGPQLEAEGATAGEARVRLCIEAKRRLGMGVSSLVWHAVWLPTQ
jgi:hypothetical protein